ncbi:Plectin like [Actinidia chinensis var. chinensis]|uniref:Plectin like n=1 Tax=Actinidia chinensis var. chinensis TaxID=1590841 RepID=A0A2R6Q365_ACTCC|nr:Plectin like [Actinidia chinensis var. chinensis]
MAAQAHTRDHEPGPLPPTTAAAAAVELSNNPQQTHEKLLRSYLGLAFAVHLGLIPKSPTSSISALQSRNRDLCLRLIEAEEELSQLRSRRKEDAKANARVVEIFAGHRHAWRREEERLLLQIDAGAAEIARLRARGEELEISEAELRDGVGELKREVADRDEMLNFVSRRAAEFEDSSGGGGEWCLEAAAVGFGDYSVSEGLEDPVTEECFLEREGQCVDEMGDLYGQSNGFGPEFLNSTSKFWAERANLWQDVHCESLESLSQMKHFVARRESPWKVDGESTGVASKLKLLEQELLNLERIGKSDLSKVPSKMRKQAKRYQALAGKIDDLCRRMQASDPCEPTLSSEFRTQRQTEFLLEAFRLQQRAAETGQKLIGLQTETGKGYFGDEMETQAKLTTRRCLDSIKNNFKEIQRNLEIWLARINGDLEGILARDGASRVRDYYVSRYPFVQ